MRIARQAPPGASGAPYLVRPGVSPRPGTGSAGAPDAAGNTEPDSASVRSATASLRPSRLSAPIRARVASTAAARVPPPSAAASAVAAVTARLAAG
ncbi:hypothetical protein [Phytohabitans suffuscus]|uniref:hypothetical protein n=1 Tax=Phytohabitans suffuscus TaxID=624315 RepID=UPI001565FF31|nr:hypothetical protein [Phytohabitans suffuscus]